MTWIKDAIERVVSTYVQVFLGLLIAGGTNAINIGTAKAAAIAAIPAALSVLKAILARQFGDPESASLAVPEAP